MLPLSSVRPGDIRHIRFSFACSRRQTTRRQSEAPKDVPDHTSCRALSRHSLTDLFAGAPHPYYRTSAPFSFSAGECKIMNHFVVHKSNVLSKAFGKKLHESGFLQLRNEARVHEFFGLMIPHVG